MNWKSWPYWKKGGAIGMLLSLGGGVCLLIIGVLAFTSVEGRGSGASYGLMLLLGTSSLTLKFGTILVLLSACIGYLYGKLKQRKNVV